MTLPRLLRAMMGAKMRKFENLEAIEAFAIDQGKGAYLEILSPVDGAAIGWRWLIAGPDSDVQARARLGLVDELAAAADEAGRVSAQAREAARLNCLAKCVLGWDGPFADGLTFNHSNVLRALRAGQWLQSQVDAFAADRRQGWGVNRATL